MADAPDREWARALGVPARFFIVDGNLGESRRLTDLVTAGIVRPIIGKRFDFGTVAEAFDRGSLDLARLRIRIEPRPVAGRSGALPFRNRSDVHGPI